MTDTREEGMGNLDGTKAVFEAYGDRITEFYSFDGYLSQCTSDAVGSHRYRVSVKETGGHSYLDFGRENAIAVISRMICDLYSIPGIVRRGKYEQGKAGQ